MLQGKSSYDPASGTVDAPIEIRDPKLTEIRIAWAQLYFFVLLAGASIYAGTGAGKVSLFTPATMLLFAYGAVVSFRLSQAYRGRLSGGALPLAFVSLDIVAVIALAAAAASLHEAPRAYAVRTAWLSPLFVIIALRALRGRPVQVAVAGMLSIAGALGLAAWSAMLDAQPTVDFVRGSLGMPVFLGGELTRIAALAGVTVVTAVVAKRRDPVPMPLMEPMFPDVGIRTDVGSDGAPAGVGTDHGVDAAAGRSEPAVSDRRDESAIAEASAETAPQPMLGAAMEKGAPEPEVSRKAPAKAPARKAPASPEKGEMRQAGILCVDVRGFSQLTAAGNPDDVKRLLAEYRARTKRTVEKHSGTIEKAVGDGILVHFGVLEKSGTFAADALRALDELFAEADTWNAERRSRGEPTLRLGFSCAVGNVFCQPAGTPFDLSVVGESVNLAARMEKHNKKLGSRALTTRQTLEMACAQGYQVTSYVRMLSKEAIEGVSFKIDIVVLAEEEKDSASRAA